MTKPHATIATPIIRSRIPAASAGTSPQRDPVTNPPVARHPDVDQPAAFKPRDRIAKAHDSILKPTGVAIFDARLRAGIRCVLSSSRRHRASLAR
ncbi:hypothetical protein D1006_08725 [Burkholderia stabilis]|uniref:Uncharacterized protein n=1 Tax=Burkholderia stabilis TaxID=95485 RepID=A0A4Q2ARH9_9BURK|nr:hypothetical protein D1006_08725 [Burkholderia stabilis]